MLQLLSLDLCYEIHKQCCAKVLSPLISSYFASEEPDFFVFFTVVLRNSSLGFLQTSVEKTQWNTITHGLASPKTGL